VIPARRLTSHELRPGDIFLCRGSRRLGSPISDWICRLDGGPYSHAAIWDGGEVLEASAEGGRVRSSDLAKLLREHEYTHVYRPVRAEMSLGDPGWEAQPVIAEARSHLGSMYPYGELCLLGVLVGLGRTTGLPSAEQFLRAVGDELTRAVREWRGAACVRPPVTCSSYVSSVFWEADPTPARRYALDIPFEPSGAWRDCEAEPGSRADRERLLELERACREVFLPAELSAPHWLECELSHGRSGERAIGVRARLARAGDRELPAGGVTPRDLQRSPSLRQLGDVDP